MSDFLQLDARYVMPTYARRPVCLVRGKGSYLWDAEGNRYLDFASGIGTASLGYGDAEYVQAISAQAQTLQHASNYYVNEPSSLAAKTLIEQGGFGDKVFFCNSGAEANEGLIKLARKYSHDQYGDGRATILSLRSSFHGRTVTTLAATGQDRLHKDFAPFTEGFRYADATEQSVLDALDETVCAILAEPIQGEGGVNILSDDFLRFLRKTCDERGLLLLFDEVQTGVGRTGRFYAHSYAGIAPDALSLAKGLAGGLPIGVFVAAKSCSDVLTAGTHGSTFGGNPVSAAAANVVLSRVTDEAFLAQVRKVGDSIAEALSDPRLFAVREVRHRGLMIGAALSKDPKTVSELCMKKGLLTLTAGSDVLRLLPPLVLSESEAEEGISILKEVLQ